MHAVVWTLALSALVPTSYAQPLWQETPEETIEAKTPEEEFSTLLEDAGRSVTRLWTAYEFADQHKWADKAKEVLLKIVEVNPYEQRAYEKLGWVQVDMMWVPPEEYPNVEKGLFKCGSQWLPIAEANQYHSAIGQEWHLRLQDPRGQEVYHFEVFSTADRDVALAALQWAEFVYPMLADACGSAPEETARIVLLRNLDQYRAFADGPPDAEQSGYSSITATFVCESLFDRKRITFLRSGITYWDRSTASLDVWGKMYARAAAALGFLEALDPSPKSETKAVSSAQGQGAEFWAEKKLDLWFRYGVAFYAAGLYHDEAAANNGADPLEVRNWLVGTKIAPTGLDPLDALFAFRISAQPESQKDISEKLMWEAGLVVAFMLEGGCQPVTAAHRALKAALRKGEGHLAAFETLEKEIKNHEAELREFAGLPPPQPAPAPVATDQEKSAEQEIPKD